MMEFELTAIDRHFAAFICREAVHAPAWLGIVVSLASNAAGNGNICLNLADIAGTTIKVSGEDIAIPSLDELKKGLQRTRTVGAPGEAMPLVLDGDGRLCLQRYWKSGQDPASVTLEEAVFPCEEISGDPETGKS